MRVSLGAIQIQPFQGCKADMILKVSKPIQVIFYTFLIYIKNARYT
jgi:hypothetical protein